MDVADVVASCDPDAVCEGDATCVAVPVTVVGWLGLGLDAWLLVEDEDTVGA